MNIKETVFNLQKVYDEMGSAFSDFQKQSGLSCVPGCGKCCLFPELESSVFETLPLALRIYREGKLDEWLQRIEKTDSICAMWEGNRETGMGKCTAYQERPTVCRIFGASGFFDKHHRPSLAVCKTIKEYHADLLQKVSQGRTTENTPMISDWYSKIQNLGTPELLKRRPINEAIAGALHLIGFHAQYQDI